MLTLNLEAMGLIDVDWLAKVGSEESARNMAVMDVEVLGSCDNMEEVEASVVDDVSVEVVRVKFDARDPLEAFGDPAALELDDRLLWVGFESEDPSSSNDMSPVRRLSKTSRSPNCFSFFSIDSFQWASWSLERAFRPVAGTSIYSCLSGRWTMR
jgi:hypothetical protein